MDALADDLRPTPPDQPWRGLALSLGVHGALIAALLWGFRWQTRVIEPIAAELWASVPQAQPEPTPPPAPRPVTPPRAETPPPRPEADIALEKQREREARQREEQEKAAREKAARDKAERDRVEREKQLAQAKAEKERAAREAKAAEAKAAEKAADAKAKADAQRQAKAAADAEAKQREANLARMMGQLGAAGGAAQGTGTAAAGGPSPSYAGRIVAAIKPNIVFAESVPGNPAAEVEVRAGPGGTIIGRTLVKSSGRPDWDEAVLRAIDRTGTLPRDTDGRVPARLTISFRPRD